MLTILAVGEDTDLLSTRANVLRGIGANVLGCSGAAALKFIAEWEFDLIALCHSVRQRDVERITEAAHQPESKTLVLLLVSNRFQEPDYVGIDLDGRSFVEPDCLVRSVLELLSRQNGRPATEISSKREIISPLTRKKPANYPADISARRALIAHFENRRAG